MTKIRLILEFETEPQTAFQTLEIARGLLKIPIFKKTARFLWEVVPDANIDP